MSYSKKKFCPYCGKENLAFAKYCTECGYEIPEINFHTQNNPTQLDTEPYSQINIPISKTTKKKGYQRLIILIALAILFIYTNPNEKMHLDFIKGKIHEKLNNDPSFSAGIFRLIEVGIGDERTNNLLKDIVRRKNFIFFSFTEVKIKNKYKIISIGILGNIFDLEQVYNYISKANRK
jgi:hypothetical protein